MSEPVEIIKSRGAGWCWRCHTCDVTVTGLLAELDATVQARGHLSSAQHLGGLRLPFDTERSQVSDDLVAFIEARLAEDESIALAAREGPWAVRADSIGNKEIYSVTREERIGGDSNVFPDAWHEGSTAHAARHDPSRVLREVAAHRRLLADIVAQQHWLNDRYYRGCSAFAEALHPDLPDLPTGRPCSCGRDADVERRLRLLAAIWSDSPGFRSEWLIEENR